ncbi:MAG: hypothetical protein BGP25_02555 [Lysobacterales bacterium 63-13]|nr:MAG: hypothetical protein BGP25_02555 [Xanthomonadales bacterium 63-13]
MLIGKLLTQLIYPLTLCLLLVPLGLLLRRRWPRLGMACCVSGLGWLLLWSLPVPTFLLGESLEQQYPQVAAAELPLVDAIVVLGGGVDEDEHGINLQAGADRVWFGATLFHAGRAPLVILSGGSVEELGMIWPEAPAMAAFVKDLGVPEAALVLESGSRTTRENAINTRPLLQARGINRILLVTSAQHMPRALATFRKLGIDAIAAPTDFEASRPTGYWLLRWMPSAAALERSSRALKEYIGIWVYRMSGWA